MLRQKREKRHGHLPCDAREGIKPVPPILITHFLRGESFCVVLLSRFFGELD